MHKAYSNAMFFALLAFNSLGANDFFNAKKEGYFYYQDPLPVEEINTTSQNTPITPTSDMNSTSYKMSIPFENPKQREERRKKEKEYMDNIPYHDLDNLSADEYRRLLDTTRDISVATPKKEYVKAYAVLQKFWIDKSETYAKVWQVANFENPEELLYNGVETSSYGRKYSNNKKNKEEKEWFDKMKDKLGLICIVDDINDEQLLTTLLRVLDKTKENYKLDYKVFDYYEVPSIVQRMSIKKENLPDIIMLYRGEDDRPIYKRVHKGIPTVGGLIRNVKFIFENAILESDKQEEDKIK